MKDQKQYQSVLAGALSPSRRTVRLAGLVLLVAAGLAGCTALQAILVGPPGSGNPITGNGGEANSNSNTNGDTANPPATSLRVSNAAPALNEDVTLTCEPQDRAQPLQGVTYVFSANDALVEPRLVVDEQAGTASFVVLEEDIGLVYTFTCRAEQGGAQGPVSVGIAVSPVDVS